MITSLWTAVSGMSTNSTSLGVVGDNIANMNTTGFKASRASFGDVLSQSLVGVAGGGQVGRGSLVDSVSPLFTQGSFVATNNGMDLAIDGNGFFLVRDNATSSSSGMTYYTRAGNFSLDKDGYMVTSTGFRVQGYMATDVNAVSVTSGNLSDIKVDTSFSSAAVTSNVDWTLNLNSQASVITAAFSLDSDGDGISDDPGNYNYSSTSTVYDSQGGSHEVTAYYTKTANNSWEVHYAYQQSTTSSVLTLATSTATQTLSFNTNGYLVSDGTGTDVSASTEPSIAFNFLGGVTNPQNITFNYGKSLNQSGTGLNASQQLADTSQVLDISQDGHAPGSLKSLNIDDLGKITAVFTNGQTRTLGQIALARFNAANRLTKEGQNLFSQSGESGEAIVNTARTSGLGGIVSGSLETSNVDLGTEFVTMITNQRAFQANSKSVTTTDELLQEILSLKR